MFIIIIIIIIIIIMSSSKGSRLTVKSSRQGRHIASLTSETPMSRPTHIQSCLAAL
jgi:preprotein translocase subunit SecG